MRHLSWHRGGLALVSLGFLAACSSSSAGPATDGGTTGDGPTGDAPQADAGPPNIHGVLQNLLNKPAPAKNVTTSALGQSTKDDNSGNWGLTLPLNQPFSQLFTSPDYATLTEQEAVLLGDFDRGATLIPDNGTVMQLTGFFTTPAYDPTLGVLSIGAMPNTTTCKSEGGGIVTVTPSGATTTTVYTASNLPNPSGKTITAGSFPSAIIYNLPVGVNLTVTFGYPAAGDGGAADGGTAQCTQTAWPVTDTDAKGNKNLQYTGNVQTIAAPMGQGATSFMRIFLQ